MISKNHEELLMQVALNLSNLEGKSWGKIMFINKIRIIMAQARGERWIKRLFRKTKITDYYNLDYIDKNGEFIYALANLENRGLYLGQTGNGQKQD